MARTFRPTNLLRPHNPLLLRRTEDCEDDEDIGEHEERTAAEDYDADDEETSQQNHDSGSDSFSEDNHVCDNSFDDVERTSLVPRRSPSARSSLARNFVASPGGLFR